jgi:hypothetical protein
MRIITMTTINSREYYSECESIVSTIVAEMASELAADGTELDSDNLADATIERLHETLDSHQWVIYTAYHLQILQISNNDNVMLEEQGEDSVIYAFKRGGLSGLHQALAFCAMYADCMDYVSGTVTAWIDDNSEA